MTKNNNVCI